MLNNNDNTCQYIAGFMGAMFVVFAVILFIAVLFS